MRQENNCLNYLIFTKHFVMINKIHKLDDFEKRVYVKTDKTKSVYNDSVNLI